MAKVINSYIFVYSKTQKYFWILLDILGKWSGNICKYRLFWRKLTGPAYLISQISKSSCKEIITNISIWLSRYLWVYFLNHVSCIVVGTGC